MISNQLNFYFPLFDIFDYNHETNKNKKQSGMKSFSPMSASIREERLCYGLYFRFVSFF